MREMGYQSSKKNSQQPKEFRGGEKKVMKKRLALLLSVAMAFSMFANVAFGASSDLTTQQKYDALVKEGIFTGIAGSNDPQLNATTTRAQFAKVLALTLGLEPVNTGNSFKDQNYSKHWAKPYVEALVKENLITGYADGKFHFNDTVTGEQMAKTFGAALGLEEVKDAAAIEGVSKWAYGWVQAVKDAGFDWSENGKWNVPAKRATLVEASYDVREQVSVQVESAKAIDEKTVEVKFTDGETEKVTLDKALVEGQETAVKVEHKGKTYEVKVTLQALAVEAKVSGLKKLDLTFNRTVDASKAKVEVKRGSTVVSVKEVKFADDKMHASVEPNSKLLQGDYTVTVTGASEKAVSATFKVEAEKVAKIELTSDKGASNETFENVKVGYRITNQYGDDITKNTSLNWTVSKGKAEAVNGILTINSKWTENGTEQSSGKFILGEKIYVTAVDTASSTVLTGTVEVGSVARADSVEFKGLYSSTSKNLNSSTVGDYYVLIDVKDQYGNKLSRQEVQDGLVFSSTNPSIVSVYDENSKPVVEDKLGEDGNSIGLKLFKPNTAYPMEGKVNINAIALASGKTFNYELDVPKAAAVKTFTLQQPDVVAKGDTVKIPFTAVDQFGEPVTKYNDLVGKVSFTSSLGAKAVQLKKDYNTGNAYLEYVVPADTALSLDVITANVVNTASISQINVNLKAAAIASTIDGLAKDTAKTLGVGAKLELGKDDIVVLDQHGRKMTLNDEFFAKYYIKQESVSNNKVLTVDGTTIKSTSEKFVVNGIDKGNARVELAIYQVNNNEIVKNSNNSISLSVADKGDIAEYKVDDVATIYQAADTAAASTYAKEVKVYGVKADGSKVVLSKTEYNVIPTASFIKYDKVSGKLSASGTVVESGKEAKYAVNVIINGQETNVLTKEITISAVAPAPAVIKAGDTPKGQVTEISGKVFVIEGTSFTAGGANLGNLVIKDQYDVTMTGYNKLTAVVTKLPSGAEISGVNGGSADQLSINNLPANSEFQITYTTENGKLETFTIAVK
ncbi:S-layer homology domain-containing protein [Paenibacillus sp. 1001270B_150601_E10]|uniref:S-layer homology domain-containing protein n=1 Tax=Paenibacillus sp. 1001270B_150601_E10 TaxID=2787079 RepID=UPI00189F3928|nr:S-layer homology domain-containing protein [Paenibacillus sp. 1001270B_150601_E10]